MQQYVEKVKGAFRIAGTRISLDSIVYVYWNGQTAEGIAQAFPALKLEQVYGALTFYLSHQAEIDEYLRQGQSDFDALRKESRRRDPIFYQKLTSSNT